MTVLAMMALCGPAFEEAPITPLSVAADAQLYLPHPWWSVFFFLSQIKRMIVAPCPAHEISRRLASPNNLLRQVVTSWWGRTATGGDEGPILTFPATSLLGHCCCQMHERSRTTQNQIDQGGVLQGVGGCYVHGHRDGEADHTITHEGPLFPS